MTAFWLNVDWDSVPLDKNGRYAPIWVCQPRYLPPEPLPQVRISPVSPGPQAPAANLLGRLANIGAVGAGGVAVFGVVCQMLGY